MTTTPGSPATTLTARCPEDVLAVVRVVLGFEPADSVVMLTLGARHSCHARVDLPPERDGLDALEDLASALLRPAVGHRADAVVLALFTDDHRQAQRTARLLRRRFERSGVACLDAVRAHDGRWHPLLRSVPGTAAGVPYDVSSHPFLVRAVLDGRVIHASRDALADTLARDDEAVSAVEAVRPRPPADGAWVAATIARHVAEATPPDPPTAARLLEAVSDPRVRDVAWSTASRVDARRHVELWSGLVRASPDDLLPHAAGVLGFLAWLAGDGALAWCAVDRAQAVDPGHSLARLVHDLLEGVVPPDVWDAHRPASTSRGA